MTFRGCAAAAGFVVALFAACAHATVADTAPSILRGPIEYPASAVSAGEEGTVQVVAEIGIDGRAGGAKIYQSSGYRDLDAAVLRSIAGWSFALAMEGGKPVAQEVVVPIRFQLDRDATGASALLRRPSVVAGILLRVLGSLILVGGVVWSWVLGKRKSVLWLWGLVPVWILAYPVFVAMHWSDAKRNLAIVSLGIILVCLGMYLAPSSL